MPEIRVAVYGKDSPKKTHLMKHLNEAKQERFEFVTSTPPKRLLNQGWVPPYSTAALQILLLEDLKQTEEEIDNLANYYLPLDIDRPVLFLLMRKEDENLTSQFKKKDHLKVEYINDIQDLRMNSIVKKLEELYQFCDADLAPPSMN